MAEDVGISADEENGGPKVSPGDKAIGERVRQVRRRRGMTVEVAAGLAGIHKSQLSRLETGQRAFTRRGLLEDLASALSCSVADLTGPVNAWELSLGVESSEGPEAAERYQREPVDLSVFGSRDREAAVHFDLARAWAQAEGARDSEAIRALDAADRLAPIKVRSDPIARDVATALRRRQKRRLWELDSLCNRLGVA